MPERRSSAPSSIRTFLAKLEAAIGSLPSNEERQQVRQAVDTIISFLTDLRREFESMPTREDVESIRQATTMVSGFMERTKENPVLSSVFGGKKARKPKRTVLTIDPAKVKALLTELETLPVDEIRSRLSTDDRSMEELRGVAAGVGIRSRDRLSREALAHQIAMKIANFRGYRQLSGESKPE